MPERTTTVGHDITLDFENCNEAFCSEKIINLDAPLPQLVLLVDKSPSCGQTVTFMCQSAPINVNFSHFLRKVYKYINIHFEIRLLKAPKMDSKSLHTFSGETVTDNTTILLGVKIATKNGLKWIVIHLNRIIVASFLSQAYVMGPSSKFNMYVILNMLKNLHMYIFHK